MTKYERQRAICVKQNNEVLDALKLPLLSAALTQNNSRKGKGNEKSQNESEDYDSGQDAGSDGDVSVTPPKVCNS